MMFATRKLAAAVALTATVSAFVAPSAEAHRRSSYHGFFQETATGASAGYDIHGIAHMVIGRRGTTVRVVVTGLDSSKTYGSHLHNGTCTEGGGGHYQDVVGPEVTPPNELWLTNTEGGLVPGRFGVALGRGSAAWQARTDSAETNARSVIVHEPGGARIACADLT